MTLAIIGDSSRVTENGLEITIQVARGSMVEFAEELGTPEQPLDIQFLNAYLQRTYKGQYANKIRLVQQGILIGTTTQMDLLAQIHTANRTKENG